MKYIIIIILIIICGWFLFWKLPVNGWHYNVGDGKQVGYISATETSGLIFKTGTIYIKPELESTQEDLYCVIDKDLLLKLNEASVNKERVEVSHISYIINGAKYCNGEPTIITSFTKID